MENTFIKLMTLEALRPYIKETKRVGYTIEGSVKSGKFKILTDECESHPAGEMVFKGIRHPFNGAWLMTFSKAYWQEPTLAECLAVAEAREAGDCI